MEGRIAHESDAKSASLQHAKRHRSRTVQGASVGELRQLPSHRPPNRLRQAQHRWMPSSRGCSAPGRIRACVDAGCGQAVERVTRASPHTRLSQRSSRYRSAEPTHTSSKRLRSILPRGCLRWPAYRHTLLAPTNDAPSSDQCMVAQSCYKSNWVRARTCASSAAGGAQRQDNSSCWLTRSASISTVPEPPLAPVLSLALRVTKLMETAECSCEAKIDPLRFWREPRLELSAMPGAKRRRAEPGPGTCST